MKNICNLVLSIIALSLLFSCTAKVKTNVKDLDLKKDVYYKKGTTAPFSGDIAIKYPSGSDSLETSLLLGKFNGKCKSYFEDGTVQSEGAFSYGQKDGKWTVYKKGGSIGSETEYKNGSFIKKCPCCNAHFWSKEGWSAVPSYLDLKWYSPTQDGGEYCSKKCSMDCRGNGF